MTAGGGGRRAAAGLFYQYLFTIETFLKLIDDGWPKATEVWIEDCGESSVLDQDIVDFSVHHPDGNVFSVHQAKSTATPERSTISANDALEILIRLVGSVDCPEYVLTTNARPGREIDRLNTLLSNAEAEKGSGRSLISELQEIASTSGVTAAAVSSLDSQGLGRLRRARVHATGESSTLIRRRITAWIAVWRRDHGLSLGERAADLLENSLITNVFAGAAGTRVDSGESHRSRRAVSLADFEALSFAMSMGPS